MKNPVTSAGTTVTVNFTFMVIYMAAISAFGSFVNDMFVPAMPEMTDAFHCSIPTMELGLTMGMIGLALGQLVLGPVSDKYGRKPALLWSLVTFIIAGAASVFSTSVEFFLVCRLFQGLGASGGYFLARTIPTDVYGGRQLARTMALIGAINGVAPAVAPVAGGFMSGLLGWKAVFVTLTLIAVAVLAFVPKMKETLPADRRIRGSIFSSFRSYRTLMHNRPFMIHVMLKGAALGLLFAYMSSATFILQRHFGFSEIDFGLIIGFNALIVAGGSMTALKFKLLKKAGYVGALMLFGAALAEFVVLFFFSHSFILYELCLIPMVFALGMIFTMGNTLAMNEGKTDAGAASAIIGIMGYIYGAIVPPVVGSHGVLHSTAITLLAIATITLIFAIFSRRLPADLGK